MKRILINNSILALSKEYKDGLFLGRDTRFKKPIKDSSSGNLYDLEKRLPDDCKNLKKYVSNIIEYYEEIIILPPSKFETYYKKYFLLTPETLSKKVDLKKDLSKKTQPKKKEFYKLVVEAMRYDAVRELDFLPFVKKMDIKACVYCNAQSAITTVKKGEKVSSKFELDHFYPKSKYPFLSTSFFNLQPCCSSCNKTKFNRNAKFNLYTDDADEANIDPFSFSLDRDSILDYLLSKKGKGKEKELKIEFSTYTSLQRNHDDLFQITNIYQEHTDIAEELLWKAKIYNESYKKSLKNSFSAISPNDSDFNRFLLGNYDQTEDIHKRPMAKLTQDIARQLDL